LPASEASVLSQHSLDVSIATSTPPDIAEDLTPFCTISIEVDSEEDQLEDQHPGATDNLIVASEELDDNVHPDERILVQNMLEDDDIEEESSVVDADSLNCEIKWECPVRQSVNITSPF
jgi:hypothetical protein